MNAAKTSFCCVSIFREISWKSTNYSKLPISAKRSIFMLSSDLDSYVSTTCHIIMAFDNNWNGSNIFIPWARTFNWFRGMDVSLFSSWHVKTCKYVLYPFLASSPNLYWEIDFHQLARFKIQNIEKKLVSCWIYICQKLKISLS